MADMVAPSPAPPPAPAGLRQTPMWKWAVWLAIAGAVVLGLSRLADRINGGGKGAGSLVTLPVSYGPANYAEAIRDADRSLINSSERVKNGRDEWLRWESYAHSIIRKARLTGDYGQLVEAGKALDTGKSLSPKGTGPVLVDAAWSMLVHDLPRLEGDIAVMHGFAVAPEPAERVEWTGMEGDLAFYRGDYKTAYALYQKAAKIDTDAGVAFRIANWQNRMGQPDAAIDTLIAGTKAARPRPPQLLSAMLLQMGIIALQRGDWVEAQARFTEADRRFPGYWLYEAHRNQMLAVNGDIPAAIRGYEAILRTNQAPEVMDALAVLYRQSGQAAPSRAWAAKAGAIWATRLAQLPAAASGHAMEHELMLGDPKRALVLAQANAAARPHGEALVMLAIALNANNRPAEAIAVIDRVIKSGWNQAAPYMVLAQANALLGRGDASEAAKAAALERNPRAFDPSATLVWFGH